MQNLKIVICVFFLTMQTDNTHEKFYPIVYTKLVKMNDTYFFTPSRFDENYRGDVSVD